MLPRMAMDRRDGGCDEKPPRRAELNDGQNGLY